MQFLMPQTQDRATSSNYSPMTGSMGKKTVMKDGRKNKIQVMAHPKLLRVESNSTTIIPRGR
jgi:hypothetical protein